MGVRNPPKVPRKVDLGETKTRPLISPQYLLPRSQIEPSLIGQCSPLYRNPPTIVPLFTNDVRNGSGHE